MNDKSLMIRLTKPLIILTCKINALIDVMKDPAEEFLVAETALAVKKRLDGICQSNFWED